MEQRIDIEYPLSTKSPTIVWGMISNAAGLQKWLADDITEENDKLVFTWGHPWTQQDTKVATVIGIDKYRSIRLRWDYFENEDAYWEMRIEKSELTGHLNLLITDYAEPDEADDLRGLWDKNLERLHAVSGL